MTAPSAKIKLTPDLVSRFRAYNDGAWGSLRIVLDDLNLDDESVQFCIEHAMARGDTEGAELGRILLALSKSQRRRLEYKAREVHR